MPDKGRRNGCAPTRDDFKQYHEAFLSAVPDLRAEVLFVVAEDAKVIANWRAKGTHLGPELGIPASGRRVDFTGLSVFEFTDGKITAGFDRWNRGEMIASLMQVRMDELRTHVGLTKREAQVALLMAERFSHTEIATQLHIKPNTSSTTLRESPGETRHQPPAGRGAGLGQGTGLSSQSSRRGLQSLTQKTT